MGVEVNTGTTDVVLPLGRRRPRGRVCWYLVSCPVGREQATCDRVRQIVSHDLLLDAFVLRRERQRKYQGAWVTHVVDMFPGFFVVVTADAVALSRVLDKLSFPAHMVGAVGRGYMPIADDARQFLEQAMDYRHVIPLSWGELDENVLHVTSGPLVGQESRVTQVVRRKSFARVRMGDAPGGDAFTLNLPLAIPERR